jgi:3-oxoadipate enol-lactonase
MSSISSRVNNLAVYTTGERKNKKIIFVHGFPYDHNMWEAQIIELSKEYFCVTYDIRGLGASPAGDGQFTLEMFVDDLKHVVDELELYKPTLCGLSMGGYIALRAIEKMQELFSAVILCDTKSVADNNEGKLKRAAAIKQINSGEHDVFVESFVRNCFAESFIRDRQSEFRKIVDRSKKNDSLGVKGCLLAMAGRTDTTESLAKINIPALVICGSEDELTPPDVMMSVADKIPNSKFVLVDGAGHMTPIEKPPIVNKAILDFLRENKI